ncbi:hypothetical protein [Haloechinothrix salitolerans]|uniref:DUF1156 domain-containing protein n=1 Tax=Haloechinothrix salitolerans TaxID=926830 RepID=A0ABW2C8W2_9PSEU
MITPVLIIHRSSANHRPIFGRHALVVWENIRDEKLLAEAHAEILASTDGKPPPIHDPFAGGGTIPLEAQRLGLEAHASDLNPVAVLINKALIEIPPKFRDQPPVFPGLADSQIRQWKRAEGLAADVRAYGAWMRDEAEKRVGHLYPKSDGKTIIAWIWARTVTCPNPACGIEMPLVRSWWLGKKKGNEAYVIPSVVPDPTHTSGQRVKFDIGHDATKAPTKDRDGTMSGRTGGVCVACQASVPMTHIRSEWTAGRGGERMLAVVTEGSRRRTYLAPDDVQEAAAQVVAPVDSISGEIASNPRWFSPPAYGLTEFTDLFTNRQLVALTTFSDVVTDARRRILDDGGTIDYANAIVTYLGMAVSKTADYCCSLAVWYPNEDRPKNLFAAQAIPMVWDFPETNPFASIGGRSKQVSELFLRHLKVWDTDPSDR